MNNIENVNSADKIKSASNVALVVYALIGAGFFLGGITWIIGIIINYVKRSDVQGTFVASHFTWQIRTFWFSVLWGIIGVALIFIYIGFVILALNFVWIIYRLVVGWLRLNDKKPMYA